MTYWSIRELEYANQSLKECQECKHEWFYDGGDYQCKKCYLISDIPEYIKDLECNYEFWPKHYDRLNYFKKIWDIMSGKVYCNLSDVYVEELVALIPKVCDWYTIYQVYKKFDLKDWWISWNIMCTNPRRIQLMQRRHIHLLYYVDNHYENNCSLRKKKKLNVMFALFKIVEFCKDDVSWVPMKLRSNCIERLDLEWKEICHQFDWPFIPTKRSLQKFNWEIPNI